MRLGEMPRASSVVKLIAATWLIVVLVWVATLGYVAEFDLAAMKASSDRDSLVVALLFVPAWIAVFIAAFLVLVVAWVRVFRSIVIMNRSIRPEYSRWWLMVNPLHPLIDVRALDERGLAARNDYLKGLLWFLAGVALCGVLIVIEYLNPTQT